MEVAPYFFIFLATKLASHSDSMETKSMHLALHHALAWLQSNTLTYVGQNVSISV